MFSMQPTTTLVEWNMDQELLIGVGLKIQTLIFPIALR